jgi:hypothetical protein
VRRQRGVDRALDLSQDEAAAGPGGLRDGEHVEQRRLLGAADVAERVHLGAPDHRHVYRHGPVVQVLRAVEFEQADQLVAGGRVGPAAALPGVDEGVQAGTGDEAGPAGADLTQQQADRAGRPDVRLDRVPGGQLHHAGGPGPVTADDAAGQPLVGEGVGTAAVPVADAEGVQHGQVARLPVAQEPVLQRGQQDVRLQDAATGTGDGDGRAVGDPRDRLGGRDAGRTGHPCPLSR